MSGSGAAWLGHTWVRAPPSSELRISAESAVVDRESGGKSSTNQTAQYRYVHPQNYESRKLTVHKFAV